MDICRENYGVKATVTAEPVFLLERDEFDELASHSRLEHEESYILAYILDPSDEKRELLESYAKITGKRLYVIMDGQPFTYAQNEESLGFEGCLPGIGAEDFVELYRGADFVVTDSFHGTAFSIIYNKPFLSIGNGRRGYSRFENILGHYGLLDRLVYDTKIDSLEDISVYLNPVDYTKTNASIEKDRIESLEWLDKALNTPLEKTA